MDAAPWQPEDGNILAARLQSHLVSKIGNQIRKQITKLFMLHSHC